MTASITLANNRAAFQQSHVRVLNLTIELDYTGNALTVHVGKMLEFHYFKLKKAAQSLFFEEGVKVCGQCHEKRHQESQEAREAACS